MFGFQEYIIGWLIYLVSVVGLLAISWSMTRCIPWLYAQQSLRLVIATFLLLPASVENTTAYRAPAWIKGFLQLVFGGVEDFLSAGRDLLMATLVVLLVYFLLLVMVHYLQRRFPKVLG